MLEANSKHRKWGIRRDEDIGSRARQIDRILAINGGVVDALRNGLAKERRLEQVAVGQVRQLRDLAGRPLPPAITRRPDKASRKEIIAHVGRQELLPAKIGIVVAQDDRLELHVGRRGYHVRSARPAHLQVDRPVVGSLRV